MIKRFVVENDFKDTRFDRWFKQKVLDIPQGLIEKLIRKNQAKVNKKKTKSSYRVQVGDIVEVFNYYKIKETKKSKSILYKPTFKEQKKYNKFVIENNENFIVVNKPSGIPVQSGTKSFKNIIDILRNGIYFKNSKPFIVHRLDKETSGVLIVAKNREYAQLLTSLFRIRKIHKTYLAISYGEVLRKFKILEDNLITYEKNKKIIQKAISYIKILKSTASYSFLELKPITGRKHQLRKQLYNIGNPIVGDDKYFIKKSLNDEKMKNLMLHAYQIKFMINGIKYNFQADINNNFKDFLKKKKLNIF